jgi:hypothetical protein
MYSSALVEDDLIIYAVTSPDNPFKDVDRLRPMIRRNATVFPQAINTGGKLTIGKYR